MWHDDQVFRRESVRQRLDQLGVHAGQVIRCSLQQLRGIFADIIISDQKFIELQPQPLIEMLNPAPGADVPPYQNAVFRNHESHDLVPRDEIFNQRGIFRQDALDLLNGNNSHLLQ